jgi:D-amino-acid dehydrogenase
MSATNIVTEVGRAPPPRSAGDEPGSRLDVIVLGAGVVGVATAYAIARQGLSVALVDRASKPARGCSFANGGQLSYAYTDALANPQLLAKMPGLVLGLNPVFRIRLADPDMLRWGLQFLRRCTAAEFKRSTLEGLQLGLESKLALHALLQRHPIAFNHAAPGKLHLLHSREALEASKGLVALKQDAGIAQHVLDAAQARALEPALDGVPDLAGAVHSPDEELGDPYLFALGLTDVLRRDYGVATHFGFDATRAETNADGVAIHAASGQRLSASKLVVALGPQARNFLRKLGISVPIMPMKGYSVSVPSGPNAPRMSITDASRKLVFCPYPGRVRIAGFAELGTRDLKVDPARVDQLIASARESLPEAADYGEANGGWAGLRPMTPSSLPIVKQAGSHVVLNVGHGMLGWTFAMGSAERAARSVMDSLSEKRSIVHIRN